MFYMKKKWGRLNRVKLGREPPSGHPSVRYRDRSKMIAWCEESLRDVYFHSDGFECFYFKDVNDGILFKLKWA